MLLEREEALEELGSLLARTVEGRGGTVLLDGEAGIGKTTLAAQARELGAQLGMRVCSAAGGELERDLPWGVARDLLRRPLTAAGIEVAPLARGVLGLGGTAPKDYLASLQPLAEACLDLAEQHPLLLVVDDAHWCDDGSARFLAYLAGRLEDSAVALVVSARPEDPRRPEALVSLAARDGVVVCHLDPLTEAASQLLVRESLPDADEDLCAACHAATSGNQFLLVELIRELASSGARDVGAVDELAIGRVDRAVARRLLAAGPDAEALAASVATMGVGAESRVATQLADLASPAGAAATDALRAAGILSASDPVGRLSFVHPLIRSAVLRALPPSARSRRHLAAARLLHHEGEPIDRIGAQLLAVEPADDQWSRDRLVEAADDASAAGAQSVAKTLLERALAERTGPRDRELLLRLGRAALAVDPAAAIGPLQSVLEETPGADDRVEVALLLAVALQGARRFDDAVEMLRELGEDLATEDASHGLRVRVEAELLAQGYFEDAGRRVRAERLPRVPAMLTGAAGEESLLVLQLAVEEVSRGTAAAAHDLAMRAWGEGALLDAAGSFASPVAMWLPYVLIYTEDYERVERISAAWRDEVQARGGAAEAVYAGAVLSEAQFRRGALREAEESALTGWRVARELGPSFTAWWIVIGNLAQALVARGQQAAAHELLDDNGLLDGAPSEIMLLPAPRVVRAEVLLAAGAVENGVEELLAARAWLREVEAPSPGAWWFPARLVEGLLRLGRDDEALAVAQEWVAEATSFGSPALQGIAMRSLGICERSLPRLEAAAESLECSGARFEHALALLEIGAARRRNNRRADAREPLRRALDLATACSAGGLAERAREELVAAGGRPRRAALSGVESLTASELRVAGLAADGLSNPQIAAALYVTRKTVEKHLSNAFDKLGVAARTELPAALRRPRDD